MDTRREVADPVIRQVDNSGQRPWTAPRTNRSQRNIPSLDGLRALSVGLVLTGHLGGTYHFPAWLDFMERYADSGVHIFFVISGYLITRLLMSEEHKCGSVSLRDFYIRRGFRILPPAYIYMTVVTILGWKTLRPGELIAAYLYLSNYVRGNWVLGHLWSLSVEEQFYGLWPLVFMLGMAARKRLAVGAVLLIPVLRVALLALGLKQVGVAHYFFTVADALATGCCLSMLWSRLSAYDSFLLSRWFIVVPVIAVTIPTMYAVADRNGIIFYQLVGQTIMHVCIALCIYNAVQIRWKILNVKPVVWCGIVSYSIYLWQQPFLNRTSHAWYCAFPINLVLAVGCAVASYYAIEQPFSGIRNRVLASRGVHKDRTTDRTRLGGDTRYEDIQQIPISGAG